MSSSSHVLNAGAHAESVRISASRHLGISASRHLGITVEQVEACLADALLKLTEEMEAGR